MNELEQGKILVTGGAGFIGSGLIWALNRLGLRDILVCDQLGEDDKWLNLAPLDFDDYVESTTLMEFLEADSPILRGDSVGISSRGLFGYDRTGCRIFDGEQLSVHEGIVRLGGVPRCSIRLRFLRRDVWRRIQRDDR